MMGILSDPCKNDDCSARVKKGANFCSVCGYAGPNSLTACPECHKKVGRTSRFCWNCGADTAETKPPRIVGDRWVREEEEIAVRVYPDDVSGFWSRNVTVEPGTIGLVERNGKFTREQEWGSHNLDSLIRGVSSIILLHAGDVVLRPTFCSLHDKNWAELDVTVQAVLEITDYDAFARHFFAGHKRRVTYSALENTITHELHDVLRGLVSAQGIDEMYGNLAWRNEFESKVRDAMSVTLSRYGLDLVQVNFVDFGGDTYEKIQQDHGETYMGSHAADHLAEKVAIRRRVADLESQGKLAEFSNNKELADKIEEINSQFHIKSALRAADREHAVAQARQEFELKSRLRQYELEDLTHERAMQLQNEQVAFDGVLEMRKEEIANERATVLLTARLNRDATQAEFEREQARLNAQLRRTIALEDSQASLEAARDKTARDIEELKVAREQLAIKHMDEAERQRLKIELQEKQAELVIRFAEQDRLYLKTVEDLKLEKTRLELEFKRYEKEKDTEVELAKIKGNVEIVTAKSATDAEVARAQKAQLEARLADEKENKKDWQTFANRQSDKDIRIAEITTRSSQGQPVIVVGGGGAQQVGGAAQAEAPCPNCNKPVPVQLPNCPYCKQSLMKL